MSMAKKAAILALATVTTSLYLAGPAVADPSDPCHGGGSFLCRMIPIMPDLDHDIDLTQNPDAMQSPDAMTGGQDPVGQPGDTHHGG
jgi:hypothetical protein